MSTSLAERFRNTSTREQRRLLEELTAYREEYRRQLEATAEKEQEARQASGEQCIAGCWVPEAQSPRVRRGLKLHWALTSLEVFAAIVLLMATAYPLWHLFARLFLP
jgi:hypothetical protein